MFSPFLIYVKVEEKTYCCTYSNPYTFARTEYLTHETNKNKRFLLLLSFSNSPLHPFGCLVNVIYSGLPSKLHCFCNAESLQFAKEHTISYQFTILGCWKQTEKVPNKDAKHTWQHIFLNKYISCALWYFECSNCILSQFEFQYFLGIFLHAWDVG